MTAAAHISAGFRNYARFSGRSPRAEYWTFAACLLGLLGLSVFVAPVLALIVLVATALPGLSAACRRLHDTGRSGKWLALPALAIPAWALIWVASAASALAVRADPLDDERWFLGATAAMLVIVAIFAVWLAGPSEPGPNAYGPNPHEVSP